MSNMYFLGILFLAVNVYGQSEPVNLRLMTFNIWNSGANVEDGLYKIAKHIKLMDPDIVALEEVETPDHIKNITLKLGPGWTYIHGDAEYPDTGIITKHKFFSTRLEEINGTKILYIDDQIRLHTNKTILVTSAGIGTQILLDNGLVVNVWAFHLDATSYGPYAANNKLVTKKEQIMAGEEGRYRQIKDLIKNRVFQNAIQNADKAPVFICGDFNAPSHLDWMEKTRDIHGDWSFEWPATKILMENASMKDSFRELHPNVVSDPGNTWSAALKSSREGWNWTIPEPQDRIDFIFYRSAILKPFKSFIYDGTEPVNLEPNHRNNDWPSDHYAVVTDFLVNKHN